MLNPLEIFAYCCNRKNKRLPIWYDQSFKCSSV